MKMKKTWLAAGLALLSTGVLSQYASAQPLMTEGDLKVGMEISYPPFESYDGDKVVGFDPELAALLAEKMDATPSFHDTKFTGLILGLGANKFDAVISGMYVTPERTKIADAIPYARTGAAILVLKDGDIKPQTEQDLCGVKVGLQQGTTWVNALQKLSAEYCETQGLPPVQIQEFPSAPEVSQALMSRNVEAQMEIAGAAGMFVERTRGRLEISSPELVYPQTLGIYIKKGNDDMKAALEQALAEIKADGSYMPLIEKYDLTPVN